MKVVPAACVMMRGPDRRTRCGRALLAV